MTYRILDLFSGAGGAAVGYHRAGFEVVGVDIEPQPRYPFEFWESDALYFLGILIDRKHYGGAAPFRLSDFDAIHASPPCQAYSDLAFSHPEIDYPELIEPVRELLKKTDLPYVIENVEDAPLWNPQILCATGFPGTKVEWNGETYQLQRHRGFETNWPWFGPTACVHHHKTLPVYGHGYPNNMPWFQGAPMAKMAREVMDTPWMTRDEFCEAIPPYYAEYVGNALRAHLDSTSNREAA